MFSVTFKKLIILVNLAIRTNFSRPNKSKYFVLEFVNILAA